MVYVEQVLPGLAKCIIIMGGRKVYYYQWIKYMYFNNNYTYD